MEARRMKVAGLWLGLALALSMPAGCGVDLPQEGLPNDAVTSALEQPVSREKFRTEVLPVDPYADAVAVGTAFVPNASKALGAPDGLTATVQSRPEASLVLDMGQEEEGTGSLKVYYRGLHQELWTTVDFLRADGSLIQTGQLHILPVNGGIYVAEVSFTGSTPYRYVRLNGSLVAIYQVDAVEATSIGAICGDGLVGVSEQCDDGNATAADGCNATCQVEGGYTCEGAPSVCTDIDECANGTANCQPGETCVNTPGSFFCQPPVCGDGQVALTEACDDGNTASGDGCNGTCQVESGYVCQGEPSLCTDIDECADGTANCQPGETCVNTPGSYTCEPAVCTPPKAVCGDQCVDLTTDAANCGACGNACASNQACVASTCVGSGSLRITATWSRPGDGDLYVITPTGKQIFYFNRGPNANTDFGTMDRDDLSGQGPENIFWDIVTPPSGTYHVCFEAYEVAFFPPISATNPLSFTVTVNRPSQPTLTFAGTYTATAIGFGCSPGFSGYLGSFTYP